MGQLLRYKSLLLALVGIVLVYLAGYSLLMLGTAWAVVNPFPLLGQGLIFQEILVQYRPQATFSEIVNTYNNLGLNEIAYSPYNGFRRVRVPVNASVYTVAANLNLNPVVAYAEPNYLRTVHFTPNDPLYAYQWHLNNPMIESTWDLTIGSNVIVAVLDSGVAYRTGGEYAQAPDLANTIFLPGYDFINDDPYPDDDNRHGTHITGTIAQSTNNLYGGAGVAHGCTILPVKVLDETGYGDVLSIADGIYYAVNNGAQVINMSLGGVRPGKGPRKKSAAEEEAVNFAVSQGVTVVCSAGNESTDLPSYPASYDATICVTATKYDLSFADAYSNYGPDVDVCAPGGDLNEDLNEDGYPDGIYQQTHDGENYKKFDFYFAEGTSSAAAFVTGVVALMLSHANQPLTPTEVRELLHTTAIDLGEPGWDPYYGWGLVNPLTAVQAAFTLGIESVFLPAPLTPFSNPLPASYLTRNPQAIPTNAINPVLFQANANFVLPTQFGIPNTQTFPYQNQNDFGTGISPIWGRNIFPNGYSFWTQNAVPFYLSSSGSNLYRTSSSQYQSETVGNFLAQSISPYPFIQRGAISFWPPSFLPFYLF